MDDTKVLAHSDAQAHHIIISLREATLPVFALDLRLVLLLSHLNPLDMGTDTSLILLGPAKDGRPRRLLRLVLPSIAEVGSLVAHQVHVDVLSCSLVPDIVAECLAGLQYGDLFRIVLHVRHPNVWPQ